VTFSADARDALVRYPWPGNVRELRNLMEMLSILHSGGTVKPRDLPPKFGDGAPAPAPGAQTLAAAIDALEERMIREVLASCDGNMSEAARRLGLRPNTLHYKMKRYGVPAR
jgi:DNA-binding NtrC family response regulator